MNSPGQSTRVGSLSLLQGIFPTQGSNPDLPHCRWILYQLSHQRSPRILECVAYPFSSRFSWPRNRTRVFCIAGGLFTNWAIKEDFIISIKKKKPRLLLVPRTKSSPQLLLHCVRMFARYFQKEGDLLTHADGRNPCLVRCQPPNSVVHSKILPYDTS